MYRRETELPACQRHKTPKQVAKYMRAEGSAVGREYETHGSVWDVPKDLLQVGLLHLIVDRLEAIEKSIGEKPLDMMAGHSAWLFRFHDRAVKAIKRHKKECERVNQICDIELLRGDAKAEHDIHKLSKTYRLAFAMGHWSAVYDRGRCYHHKGIVEIEEKTKRLQSVRTLKDIENLRGIGKSTAAKIREKLSRSKLELDTATHASG